MLPRSRPLSWYKVSVKVLDTSNTDVHKVRFLDERLRGTLVHWKGRSSQVCQGDECRSPTHEWPAYWKGWAAGEWWIPGQNVWVPVVISGTANFELQTRGKDLRGQIWRLWKEGTGKGNWPMFGRFEEQSSPDQLGRWFDMEIVLRNMVYPHKLILDVPNPTPAKVILPTNAAPAPKSESSEGHAPRPLSDLSGIAAELAKMMAPPVPQQSGGKINGNSREGANAPAKQHEARADQADDRNGTAGKNSTLQAGR